MKKGLFKRIAVFAAVSVMAVGMFSQAAMAEEEKHEHVFTDGICECGKYEAAFITRIPLKEKYTKQIDETGTLETLTYTTPAYAFGEDKEVEKTLQVYLPYGYDPSQTYNVVYLMHGGGESEYYWLNDEPVYEGTKAMGKTTKAVVDNMLKDEKIEPTIFVAPTSVTTYNNVPNYDTDAFAKEFREIIVPLIDSTYSTYAKGDVSEENLKATRDHRAFCGFSMGSICTINAIMMNNLDIVGWFGAYSGAKTEVADFKAAVESCGPDYPILYMYNGNGTTDIAHDEHDEFAHGILAEMPDWFQDGKNFCWIDFKGGSHAYNCWIVDLYNSMLVWFR